MKINYEKLLKLEIKHIKDNYKNFGYSKKPHKQNIIDDILLDFPNLKTYLKNLYINHKG